MKHALFLIALALLFVGVSASAQEDFLRLDNEFLTEKKLGFYDLFTMTTEERTAQNLGVTEDLNKPKASVDDLMERFISNCLNQPADNAKEENIKEFLCLCTAAQATEIMEPEEIRTMFSIKDDARAQQERMMGLAFMPCTEKPASYLVAKECEHDRFVQSRTTQIEKACACVGEKVGKDIAEQKVRQYIGDNDPLEDLLHKMVERATKGRSYESASKTCSFKH